MNFIYKILAIVVLLVPFCISDKFHYPFVFPKSILFQALMIPVLFLIIYEKIIKIKSK